MYTHSRHFTSLLTTSFIYLLSKKVANGSTVCSFGLTEPAHGSDPAGMQTTARKAPTNDYYILNGSKSWITLAPIADMFFVWAKTLDGEEEDAANIRGTSLGKRYGGFGDSQNRRQILATSINNRDDHDGQCTCASREYLATC